MAVTRPLTARINIKPRTKGRPRLGRRRKAYTPAATLEFERQLREQFQKQIGRRKPLAGPVKMEVMIGSTHIDIKVTPLQESSRPKGVTGDIDNYQKAIQDALNTVAFLDDKQVETLEVDFTRENP